MVEPRLSKLSPGEGSVPYLGHLSHHTTPHHTTPHHTTPNRIFLVGPYKPRGCHVTTIKCLSCTPKTSLSQRISLTMCSLIFTRHGESTDQFADHSNHEPRSMHIMCTAAQPHRAPHTPPTTHTTLHTTVHRTLHSTHRTLHSVHRTLHSAHRTLHSAQVQVQPGDAAADRRVKRDVEVPLR